MIKLIDLEVYKLAIEIGDRVWEIVCFDRLNMTGFDKLNMTGVVSLSMSKA